MEVAFVKGFGRVFMGYLWNGKPIGQYLYGLCFVEIAFVGQFFF